MRNWFQRSLVTRAPRSTVLIRLIVGGVFLSEAHEARTDWAMLLGSLFLLIEGAGPWSIDHTRTRRGTDRDA